MTFALPKNPRHWMAVLSLLICVVLSLARLQATSYSGRYVGHLDERRLFKQAVTVIEGDLNPHSFKYPSLPIYLTAAAMKGSLVFFPVETQGAQHVFHLPQVKGQRYHPSRPMEHARLVFSLLAALLFFLVALLSVQLTGSLAPACLAPLLLSLDPLVQCQSVVYQNVDLPATLFSLAALASAFLSSGSWGKSSLLLHGVFPGVLCGFAIASKYNAGVVLLSCALAVLVAPAAKQRWITLSTLGLSAVAAFVMTVPYSILDFEHFRADVLFEIRHYQTGHPGYDGEPGWSQLCYYLAHIKSSYGALLCSAAVVGLLWGLKERPRPTLVVLSFPLLMLLHMSTNRVHFLRTVLPVFVLVPVLASVGAFAFYDLATQLGGRYWKWVVVSVFLVATFTHAEAGRILDRNIRADTRDRAAAWLIDNTQGAAHYYVSRDLWMPKEDLPGARASYLGRNQERTLHQLLKASGPAYLLMPHYGSPEDVPPAVRRDETERARYLDHSRHLAEVANREQHKLMEKLNARRMVVIEGKPSALRSELEKAISTDHPQIEIYYWPGHVTPSKS